MGTALSSSGLGCPRSWSLWVPQVRWLMALECQLGLGTALTGQCPHQHQHIWPQLHQQERAQCCQRPCQPGWALRASSKDLETSDKLESQCLRASTFAWDQSALWVDVLGQGVTAKGL